MTHLRTAWDQCGELRLQDLALVCAAEGESLGPLLQEGQGPFTSTCEGLLEQFPLRTPED